jgi:hypothetical protein
MNEPPDDNPYQAPQATPQVVQRRLPPHTWWGVVGVAAMLLAERTVQFTPLEGWQKYVAVWALGCAEFLFVVFLYRSFLRPEARRSLTDPTTTATTAQTRRP